MSTNTPAKSAASTTNGARIPMRLRRGRGDERAEHEARELERGQPPEVLPDLGGIAHDDDAPDRRARRAAAEPEQHPRHEEHPERAADRRADHGPGGRDRAAAHEERDVPAVGEAGEAELRAEAGEEARRRR